jgi:hypothetical protein
VTFLARWPAGKARQHARDRIRELTRRSRLLLPVKRIVEDLNRFLGGRAAFFRFGNGGPLREGQELCADPAGPAYQQASPPLSPVRLAGGYLPVP